MERRLIRIGVRNATEKSFFEYQERRAKDMVDDMSKLHEFRFEGISVQQALEIMSNGDCGEREKYNNAYRDDP